MTREITRSTAARPATRIVVAYAIVVALAAAVCLHRLGAPDVCGANEAVEAVFLQQMVEHDALLFPLENGRAPMYKPPLFHWTAVALDRVAGARRVTAFNLRLPAALYAIAGVVLTIIFAAGFLGPPGAILAGLILAASYQYIENARIGRVDMTLCFFETLALFAFMWWYAPAGPPPSASAGPSAIPPATGRDALRYLLALALGLAVLAKGPVGAILPGLAIAIFLIAEKRPGLILRLATPGPVILTLALGASWYLACLFGRRYGFLDRQLGSENFGRFFGALGAMAPWYYLKPILLNSAPLSLLVPFAVAAALRTWGPASIAPATLSAAAADDELPAQTAAPQFPPSTHPQRPAQNPLSLWMSLRMMFLPPLDTIDPADAPRARAAVRLFAIFWIVTVVFFTVAAYKRRAYLLPLWPASAVTLAWWLDARAPTQYGPLLRRTVGATCAILIVFNFFYLPYRAIRECAGDSFRIAAAQINRVVGPSEPLYLYDFTDEPAPLLFYLDRPAPRISGKLGDAPPGYVLAPVATWDRLKPSALDLTPVLETSSGRPRLVLLRRGPALANR
ncbi:MAG: phospholipid carrier-dependent glycosyltransferase [Candidatus Binataceae bacterium]|nr:phospholipid carrier-dependent glycosyltransferase [Candidatus Binataceae bacterium]